MANTSKPLSESVFNRAITGIKGDITGLKGDVAGIKGDIIGIKEEIKGIHQRMDSMETRLEGKIGRVAIEVANMKQDMREMKHKIETELVTKPENEKILSQLDYLVSMWKEQYQKGFFNQNRLNILDDHVADHVPFR